MGLSNRRESCRIMIPVRNGPPQRPSGRASAGVISNGIKKIFRLLPLTLHRLSYAAFAPLAEYKGTRLAGIYSGDLYTFLNLVFVIALSVGAVMAVLQLAVAGYMYMGSDLWQNKQKVKDKIRDAFIGLFLLLSVWIVLNLINPNILKLNLIFPKIDTGAPPATAGTSASPSSPLSGVGRALRISSGPCAPNPIFAGYARQMSCICGAESGGQPNRPSETDRTVDGRPVSTGLYQINLSANPVYCPGEPPLDCRPAFSGRLGSSNIRPRIIDENLYSRCIAAANRKECSEATAHRLLNQSGLNNWGAWRNGNQSTCI